MNVQFEDGTDRTSQLRHDAEVHCAIGEDLCRTLLKFSKADVVFTIPTLGASVDVTVCASVLAKELPRGDHTVRSSLPQCFLVAIAQPLRRHRMHA
jgi:hypothetical protein